MKASKTISALCVAAAIGIGAIAIGCGDGGDKSATDSSANGASGLTGAGSTFINPAMTQWTAAYEKSSGVHINYQPNGSGGGITALVEHTVDFAASDAPMNDQETAEAKAPVLHLPGVIGATAIAYNVEGAPTGLHLSGPIIAGIFLGTITKWNDPQIAALNQGMKLPSDAIFVAHRSDGSGTTYMFTDYLSKVSPDWKSKIGVGKSVEWPVGLGGKGSSGVAALLKTHPDSIGYVELSYAEQTGISFASVQNPSGAFIAPSADSATSAAEGATIPDSLTASLTNSNNPKSYPISGFSYLIVYQSSAKSGELKKFVQWVLGTGQTMTKALSYGPIPDSLIKRELAVLDGMK